jgi:hypothetical protein
MMSRVKWESGEVVCHQQVGMKSARDRFAVLEHIDIAVSAVHEQEPAGRVILLMPTVEQQRVDAVAAESDVDEPGTARVGRAHHQRHVVQRGAGVAVAPIYPRGDAADLGTHGL